MPDLAFHGVVVEEKKNGWLWSRPLSTVLSDIFIRILSFFPGVQLHSQFRKASLQLIGQKSTEQGFQWIQF